MAASCPQVSGAPEVALTRSTSPGSFSVRLTQLHGVLPALRAGGRASLLGIPTESVPLDLVNDVIFKGATVQGIYGRRMYETWVQMTALLKAGRLNLEPLFGERAPLEKFETAFAKLQGGLAGKILLYPDGMPT